MSRFGSITLAAALALAACGSDAAVDASKDTAAEDTATTAVPTTEAPATTVEETTTTTAAPTTTTTEATTTTTAAPVIDAPAGSVPFVAPAGEYTLQIGSDWVDATADLGGITGWFTGESTVDFAENVNILTDTIPTGTPLQVVLSASADQIAAEFDGFNLLVSEVLERPGQEDVGVLEYTAFQGAVQVRFVQVFGIWNDTLVVFTGSTDGGSGDEGADRLRPYALTLAPVG